MDKFFSSSILAFAKKLVLGYLPFSCVGVLLIFATVAGSSSWGAILGGGFFMAVFGGAFLVLQLAVFCFRIDPLRRFLKIAAFTSVLNLLLGLPVLAFLIQSADRWSLNDQVENEPIVRCKKLEFRVQSDSEITQARQLMYQFAIDTHAHYEDSSSGLGVRATVQGTYAGSKFVLVSLDVPDKYLFTILHLGGGTPIRKGITTDYCNSEREVEAFDDLQQRFSSRWTQ